MISGTPKKAGTYTFTIKATDSKKPAPKRVTQKVLSIVVT